MQPAIVEFKSFAESVPEALDAAGGPELLAGQEKILLKPNLVFAAAHPVTTADDCCRAAIDYIRAVSAAEIIIAEGSGDPGDSTADVFSKLGYAGLARSRGVELLDLNTAPFERYEDAACPRLPELYLPAVAKTHFILSLPVLKAHTLSGFTGSLKNMMGFAPPAHYAGAGGIWNKAALHRDLQQAIIDLNRYRSPDLTLMDAAIGLPDQHLGGRHCDPPVGKLVAGRDARSVDRASAELLGLDWKRILHLT